MSVNRQSCERLHQGEGLCPRLSVHHETAQRSHGWEGSEAVRSAKVMSRWRCLRDTAAAGLARAGKLELC